MVIAGDKVRGTITQWTADHGNSVSFCSNGTVCWLKHHPALTGGAGQESCGEKSPALLVPGVQLRLSFKGLTPSICSYIITGLRLTTTAAWRSSGTHCAVPGLILQFPHCSRQANDLSLGGILHGNTSANPKASAGYRERQRRQESFLGNMWFSSDFSGLHK